MRTPTHSRKLHILLAVLLGLAAVHAASAQVVIAPTGVSLPVGSSRQFSATVSGAPASGASWTVNGLPGGDSTVGYISPTGLYYAPAKTPAGYAVTIGASVSNPAGSGSTTLIVREQIPWLTTITPTTVATGAFSLTVTGSRFVNGAQVRLNGVPVQTAYVSSTQLTATGSIVTPGTVALTVANPGPGAVSTPLSVVVSTATVVSIAPTTTTVDLGTSTAFQATVSNASDTSVTWQVNGKIGGGLGTGTITPAGIYTAPAMLPVGGLVTVTAVANADGVTKASAKVLLKDPQALTFSRFLSQATFGPTPATMAHAEQVGMLAFLDEQFATAESPIPPAASATRQNVIDAFMTNIVTGNDQLRQRVIFALSEVLTISFNKNTNGNEVSPWLQILSRNAFGNYRTLLRELSTDATMGHYLDLVNSSAGAPGTPNAANENYPREVMQLFSIGLYKLNLDGSVQKDANGPIPSYTQFDVQQLAKAMTGWTYPNSPGSNGTPGMNGMGGNYAYAAGTMLPMQNRHDLSAKLVLGQAIPGGQSAQQDMDDAITILFNHPNVGPFIATRLIRALVTSNPSPAYITRVATVFNGSQGTRGDMQATIRAVLMDPEARDDNPPPTFGRLRTAIQTMAAFVRAMGYPFSGGSGMAYLFEDMNEGPLNAASVFGHYSPSFKIPKSPLYGPEFQIYAPSDAANRANLLYGYLFNPWPIHPLLQPFVALAGDSLALVTAVDNAVLFGRMSPGLRAAITAALPAMGDDYQRTITAFYLAIATGEFQVQR